MLPSLQPSRPKYPPPTRPLPVQQQQQTRQQYDSAVRHPVFFTATSYTKPPFAVPGGTHVSPVAQGYVFAEERAAATKL
ncbi:uncharacterized protein K452DRAFT_296876 [Aplosporella prunicola CBS 121167]|uniref:Uncharacterized protein n=1 Tax=Aplosporella prunicola CBS 121167 TaxID=1176127 RepID=A0A6A6BKW5_9PEZI|nr:uncharacterized protein K452DRAFT_296876 [Aplosporella prunicola CBS 121167]KAF2143914.1 hypothetical protein K452DRAFT_296876 [Aplosporella prunicola CBS 121167]